MGADSAIEWTHHTFNPWWGCEKVSPGCTHCYAEAFAKRTGHAVWGGGSPRRLFGDKHWEDPRKWDRAAAAAGERHRVFCASMADVFEDRRDLDAERGFLWELIAETPALDWLLLTKRPENMRRMLPWGERGEPWRNVWLGTTAEDQQRADERIPVLLDAPAAVRFVSAEPLLGPIEYRMGWLSPFHDLDPMLRPTPRIDWTIIGGESGPGARPCEIAWMRALVEQIRESEGTRSTHSAVFVKQLGAKPIMTLDEWHALTCIRDRWTGIEPAGTTKGNARGIARLLDAKGGDIAEFPANLRVREFPVTSATAVRS